MPKKKTLSLLIMDPPYESAKLITAFRIMHAAIVQGHNVNVFAFEGAVSITMKEQKAHANPVKNTSVEEEKHPTTKDWVSSLFAAAQKNGCQFNWINCGLCVDERGAGNWIEGPQRGSPKQFLQWAMESDTTITITAG